MDIFNKPDTALYSYTPLRGEHWYLSNDIVIMNTNNLRCPIC